MTVVGPIPDVDTSLKEQAILNRSFDAVKKSLTSDSPPLAIKLTTSGNYTYVGKALVGSSQSDACWQVMRIDETTGMVILWADGDALFDNVATDLTALSYS